MTTFNVGERIDTGTLFKNYVRGGGVLYQYAVVVSREKYFDGFSYNIQVEDYPYETEKPEWWDDDEDGDWEPHTSHLITPGMIRGFLMRSAMMEYDPTQQGDTDEDI